MKKVIVSVKQILKYLWESSFVTLSDYVEKNRQFN